MAGETGFDLGRRGGFPARVALYPAVEFVSAHAGHQCGPQTVLDSPQPIERVQADSVNL